MEECLRILIERPEWEGDTILTTQLRCMLITQQITDIYLQQALLGQELRIPLYFQQSLSAQLTDIWRTIPPNIAQQGMSFSNGIAVNSSIRCRDLVIMV